MAPVDSEELRAVPANDIGHRVAVDPDGPESLPEPELSVPLCLNGHEYAKCQLRREGIGFKALDNGFVLL